MESPPFYLEVPARWEGMIMEGYTFGLDRILMFLLAFSSALVIVL